jgi:hypothetical protein
MYSFSHSFVCITNKIRFSTSAFAFYRLWSVSSKFTFWMFVRRPDSVITFINSTKRDLRSNQLSGSIPKELSALTRLTSLSVLVTNCFFSSFVCLQYRRESTFLNQRVCVLSFVVAFCINVRFKCLCVELTPSYLSFTLHQTGGWTVTSQFQRSFRPWQTWSSCKSWFQSVSVLSFICSLYRQVGTHFIERVCFLSFVSAFFLEVRFECLCVELTSSYHFFTLRTCICTVTS